MLGGLKLTVLALFVMPELGEIDHYVSNSFHVRKETLPCDVYTILVKLI